MIKTIEDLKDYFLYSKDRFNDYVCVDTKIRKEWMLNAETTIIEGRVYRILFKNLGGGVWKATIAGL
uniref:Uncharacterized protein n=1 Tax=viral metagenome TaxID=1070528 RepID=A0A6M3JHX9_9ZZZZ